MTSFVLSSQAVPTGMGHFPFDSKSSQGMSQLSQTSFTGEDAGEYTMQLGHS